MCAGIAHFMRRLCESTLDKNKKPCPVICDGHDFLIFIIVGL